jgi:hypothetical protein
MVERDDPARTGVKAGRVVGLLTAVLVVVSLLRVQDGFVGRLETIIGLVGIDPGPSITVYFYLYLVGAATGRYALCYVVGSLIGVVYDWLEQPPIAVVAGLVLVVGVVDGFAAGLDTRSTLTGVAYVVAWLCYLPAFVWLSENGERQDGPVRLGET